MGMIIPDEKQKNGFIVLIYHFIYITSPLFINYLLFLTFSKQNNWISQKIVYSKDIINVEGYKK
ncbi:hypothetical protein TKO01_17430 [Tetragenococcus koreensis]|nr:hypothetical protein C7K43_11940 [Tetragenococcus koreensis]GEN91697.1 hypothetical protein TKO01_17430 [Tetragenococcus koreensis]